MTKLETINKERMPRHVAIIMDGNGRWAKSNGKPRIFGHTKGVETVRTITECAAELGIEYLTLYAFSTENWNRPQDEIAGLMTLLVKAVENETERLYRNNVRLTTIGDLERLPEPVRKKLLECIDKTSGNTGLTLVLALSYSARWEITKAVKEMAKESKNGIIDPETIDETMISAHMSTKDIPDPELLIRTSGEQRISNFLLWQLAYTELYFTQLMWPEFDKEAMYDAIIDYQGRERRFGKTSEQI